MKTLILSVAIASIAVVSCSKNNDQDRAFSATIIDKPLGVNVGDSSLRAVLAVGTKNDTLLLANIPKTYNIGQNIKFNIRPLKSGDPVVVIAVNNILPPLQFVKD